MAFFRIIGTAIAWFFTQIWNAVKYVAKKFEDLLTDSNGDGDILRVFGLAVAIAGLWGWLKLGKAAGECIIMMAFGCGLLITGKLSDPTPKG